MKKIKLRFSYFLIAGIIGSILQIVEFFSWTNYATLTSTQLVYNSSTTEFQKFLNPSIIAIFAVAMMLVMLAGYFICAKKEQFYIKLGAATGFVGGIVNILSRIIYLILASKNRADMFKAGKAVTTTLNVLVSIKNITTAVLFAGLLVIGIGLLLNVKQNKIGKSATYLILGTNAIAFFVLFAIIISSLNIDSYKLISTFIETTQVVKDDYEMTMHSMNGLTFGQLNRICMIISEIKEGYRESAAISALNRSAIFALCGSIAYMVAMVGNFFGTSLMMVESFDVEKDDEPMSI